MENIEKEEEEIIEVEVPELKKTDKRSITSKLNMEKARLKALESKAMKKAAVKKVKLEIKDDSGDEIVYKLPGKSVNTKKQKLYEDIEEVKKFMNDWKDRKAKKNMVVSNHNVGVQRLAETALHGTNHDLKMKGGSWY